MTSLLPPKSTFGYKARESLTEPTNIFPCFFLKDGFDSGLDEAETIDIPVKLIKKWTDFKKRAHARRLLLSRFD